MDDFFIGVFVLLGVFLVMFVVGAIVLLLLGEPVI